MMYSKLLLCLAALLLLIAACVPPTAPAQPNYEATLAAISVEATFTANDLAVCEANLLDCISAPTQTPHVIVVTPVPPTNVPPTPTPQTVSCENLKAGTAVKVTTRTTVRSFHSDSEGQNLGQAEVGTLAVLIDTWYDTGTKLRWIKADSFETNDHPEGVRGYVKETYAGCVP